MAPHSGELLSKECVGANWEEAEGRECFLRRCLIAQEQEEDKGHVLLLGKQLGRAQKLLRHTLEMAVLKV